MEKEPTNRELLGAIQDVRTGLRSELLQAIDGVRTDLRTEILQSQAEVLEAMQEFATNVDQRFNAVDRRFDRVEGRLTRVEGRLTSVESGMVTKAYLDDKLADEGVRYGGMIRETNEKVCAFADALVAEKSLSVPAASRIKLMRPFPRRLPR